MRWYACSLVVVLMIAQIVGCSNDGYRVVVTFDSPELAHDVTRIDIAVVQDCEAQDGQGETIDGVIKSVEVQRGEAIAPFGKLEPGSFGIYGRGTSSWCQVIGLGCRQVTLEEGGRGNLEVVLNRIAGATCEQGTECRDSRCTRITDGSPDVGTDGDSDGDGDGDGDGDVDGDADADSEGDAQADADPDPCGCTIDGECVPTGAIRFDQPCLACRPELDATDWSLQVERGPCRVGDVDGTCWYIGENPFCCTGCWLATTSTCMPGSGLIWCGIQGVECFTCEGGTVCNAPLGVCEEP